MPPIPSAGSTPPMKQLRPWQKKLHTFIYEADTPSGKLFDLVLLGLIIVSVVAVVLDSVAGFRATHGPMLRAIEWVLTILFSVEYVLRLVSIGKPSRYAFSAFGIIDLLAILPTYLSIFVDGGQSLLVIRALRLLRAFRVLKLARFVGEASLLRDAMRASMHKIIVFLFFVVTLVIIIGAVMYLVEGEAHGFTNIPISIYWTIVTMTTVGYGDLAPQTVLGRVIASIVMILGYGIIAVPTGIVTSELTQGRMRRPGISTQACEQCGREGHDTDARCCKFCGWRL